MTRHSRRAFLALPLLAFTPLPHAVEDALPPLATVIYGPVVATSRQGERYWEIITEDGPVALQELDAIIAAANARPGTAGEKALLVARVIRAAGEWVLVDGWPHHWSAVDERWIPLL